MFKLRVAIDNKSIIRPLAFTCSYASSVVNKNAEYTYDKRNPLTLADSAYKFCGFHLHFAESKTTSYRYMYVTGILRYRYMYAESTEILFVESTYILEHILRLVSGIQTQNCALIHCTVWHRNVK